VSGTNLQTALGQAIRKKRAAAGFSQESFAEAVGVHRTYIGGVERGERNVSLHNLQRISEALNVSLSALIQAAEKLLEASTTSAKAAQSRRPR
jgi:transcriptional regulator with XRE-family HTH domain